MIKEALQYIVGLGEANLLDVEGCTYSDKIGRASCRERV